MCARRTVDVHPALVQLDGAVDLDVIGAVAQALCNRRVQQLAERACATLASCATTGAERKRERRRHARFSTNSLRPAPASAAAPGRWAGSQPATDAEDACAGGAGENETAKAGSAAESGVGGGRRW
jgi:hypothetical protein